MKNILLIVLLIITTNVFADSSAIFQSGEAYLLKPVLKFKESDVRVVTNQSATPSSVAYDAIKGSLYIQSTNGILYQKQDNGLTTNWAPLLIGPAGSGTDECVARWNGTGVSILQDSVFCITDVGNFTTSGTGVVGNFQSTQVSVSNATTDKIIFSGNQNTEALITRNSVTSGLTIMGGTTEANGGSIRLSGQSSTGDGGGGTVVVKLSKSTAAFTLQDLGYQDIYHHFNTGNVEYINPFTGTPFISFQHPNIGPTQLSVTGGIINSVLTASRVMVSSANKTFASSSVSTTQLGYLDATSSVQTQINTKITNAIGSVSTAQILDGTILNTDVATSAAITATKISTGVVSNAEFDFLDGVTSLIQTQFGTKLNNSIGSVSTAQILNSTILNEDIANTTIDLTAKVTGVLPFANGGTNASTSTAAINGLLVDQSGNSGKFLSTDGTNISWQATALSSSVSLTNDVTGFLPIARAGTASSVTGGLVISGGMAASTIYSATGSEIQFGNGSNGITSDSLFNYDSFQNTQITGDVKTTGALSKIEGTSSFLKVKAVTDVEIESGDNSYFKNGSDLKKKIGSKNPELNVLQKYPSFEESVSEGSASGATATQINSTEGNGTKSLSFVTSASTTGTYTLDTALSVSTAQQAVLLVGAKTSSSGAQIISRANGADVSTISIIGDGQYHAYELPVVCGTTSCGYKIQGDNDTEVETVELTYAYIEAGTIVTLTALTENVLSAKISSTGVVSEENQDFINGDCTNASSAVCTFNAVFTVTANCVATPIGAVSTGTRISAQSAASITVDQLVAAGGFNLICQKQGVDYNASKSSGGGSVDTDWAVYTPTFTGFGTVSGSTCYWRRDMSDMLIRCTFSNGTNTATEARLSLAAGRTSSSAIYNNEIAGKMWRGAASTSNFYNVLIEPSVTYVTFSAHLLDGSQNPMTARNGDALSDGQTYRLEARVPIQVW